MLERILNKFQDLDTREILSKGSSFMLIRVLGLMVGYVFTFFVTRVYGADIYGLVTLSFSLFIFFGILGRMGIDINLVKFYSNENNIQESGLFYKSLINTFVISALLAIVLYLGRDYLSTSLFKKPQLQEYLAWVAVSIPFWAATLVCAGFLRARKMNKWFALLNNPGRFILTTLFLVVLWLFKDSPLNAIKAHTYGIIVLALLAFIMCVRVTGRITIKTNHSIWRFTKEAFPMMLSSTMLVLLGWLDTFVLGIYETDTNIGIYNVALKIAALTSFSLQSINSILAPKLADSFAKEEMTLFNRLTRFSAKLNFFTTLGIVISVLVFHRFILSIFGSEFLEGATILILLCTGQLVNALSGSVGTILQMTGKQKVYQNIILLALILNIVLNFVLIPLYGGLGAAIATVCSMSSWNISGALYLKRKMNITSFYNFK